MWSTPLDRELAAKNDDRASAEFDTIAIETYAQHAATRRRLVGDEFVFAETLRPERGQTAVRRAGDRILIDARSRRKVAGDKIVFAVRGAAGDDHAAHLNLPQRRVIRFQAAHIVFRVDLDEIVEFVAANVSRTPNAERVEQPGRKLRFLFMCGWAIDLDPFAPLRGCEQAALCMKSSDVRRLQEFFFPQRVG